MDPNRLYSHQLTAVDVIEAILQGAPRVHVLATSRSKHVQPAS